MHIRGGNSQWQSRRKISLGPVRRAHPASGATWNVQVVRGKMTSRCLWHACRALAIGLVLMLLGAGMATIGYYAKDLSIGQEIRGNATVRVQNESRGFHLNNFSYAGPIVMGFGGFIVVAACVMTFEARDSAAKVVPARFKLSTTGRPNARGNSSRRTTGSGTNATTSTAVGSQTSRWDNHMGVFKTSPGDGIPDRKALTAALVHFSKALGNSRSPRNSSSPTNGCHVSRSGSVPNLVSAASSPSSVRNRSPNQSTCVSPSHRISSNRSLRPHHHVTKIRRNHTTHLHPSTSQLHRHALSVDESGPYFHTFRKIAADQLHQNGSQTSIRDPELKRIRERTKRSDTAKRHILARQRPIEKEDSHHTSRISDQSSLRRESSATSDVSSMFRRVKRSESSISRTPSIESKAIQTDAHVISRHSRVGNSPKSPGHGLSTQISTPSVEKEFKSQLSICSEPATTTANVVSSQTSIDPCVPEECVAEVIVDSKQFRNMLTLPQKPSDIMKRPDSLILACPSPAKICEQKQKFLYRSNSSITFKRTKLKQQIVNELDQIYFISSNKDDDNYDSIEVIDERRQKNFIKSNSSGLIRNTSEFYDEYCSLDRQDANEKIKCSNLIDDDQKINKSEICSLNSAEIMIDTISTENYCKNLSNDRKHNQDVDNHINRLENNGEGNYFNDGNQIDSFDEQPKTTILVKAEIESYVNDRDKD